MLWSQRRNSGAHGAENSIQISALTWVEPRILAYSGADVATRLPRTPPFSRLLRHAGGYSSRTILTPNLQWYSLNIRGGNVKRIFTRNIPRIFPEHCHTDTNIRISVSMFREYSRNICRKYSLDITPANIQGIRTAGSGLELSCCCSLLHVVRRRER